MEKELLAQSLSVVGIGHLSTRGPHSVSSISSESSNKITGLQSFSSEPAEAVLLPGTHSCTKTHKPNFCLPQELEVLVHRASHQHALLFGAWWDTRA